MKLNILLVFLVYENNMFVHFVVLTYTPLQKSMELNILYGNIICALELTLNILKKLLTICFLSDKLKVSISMLRV